MFVLFKYTHKFHATSVSITILTLPNPNHLYNRQNRS